MSLLNALQRCPGIGCPSKEICLRFPVAGDEVDERAVMTALYVRRPNEAAACDQYLLRDVPAGRSEVPHAA